MGQEMSILRKNCVLKVGNQIGIREFVDHLVQEFDNETYILKGGDC